MGNMPLAIRYEIEETKPFSDWFCSYIMLFYSKDWVNSPRIDLFVAMLWSLWVIWNERIFKDVEGHTGKVPRCTELGLAELEIYKSPNKVDPDHSLVEDQLVQPPGFNYVHLGRQHSSFPNFVLQVDGSWKKASKKDGIGWAINHNS